jgi:arylsulfatase A-like enzyme
VSRAACVLAFVALSACGPPRAPEGPPSFVLVLADDLGWADVGFQGAPLARTPELERLAREGLVFAQAYAASPVCSPSRAALVSGLAPARLHLTSVVGANTPTEGGEERKVDLGVGARLVEPTVVERLPPELPTLATRLAERGYSTGWIGKWHLGGRPSEHGFAEVVADSGAGAVASYFAPYGLATIPAGPKGEYLTDRLTDEAVGFLARHAERPFLLVLAHYAPHLPLEAPPELVAACAARAGADTRQHPIYAAMIERLDASVGRLRSELERLGLAERTLLVFTSDNGGFEERRLRRVRHGAEVSDDERLRITSNQPLRGGKGRCTEGGLRVPLVLWGGPLARRGASVLPVIGTDLAPTLLALAGATPLPLSDGEDLAPYLRGGPAPARAVLGFHFPHQSSQSALRRGSEKLLYSWATEASELYDLETDPSESNDLAAERPERVAALRAELFEWLDALGADRPRRLDSPR